MKSGKQELLAVRSSCLDAESSQFADGLRQKVKREPLVVGQISVPQGLIWWPRVW